MYRCKECETTYEAVQSMTEAPASLCPGCQGPLYRVPQPVGIQYRGRGFHCTDYPSKSRRGKGHG